MRGRCAFVVALLLVAACGGGDDPEETPADRVRAAVSSYLGALQDGRWERACRLMTAGARAELEAAAGTGCVRALAAGAALAEERLASAARALPGAAVRVRGASATVGPLGGMGQPLRLERAGERWLVAG